MANYAYLVAFAPSYLVTHAFAVRLGRAVELTGRLQGRSTINLLAGGLCVLVLGLTAVMCRLFGIPVGIGAGAGAIDVALFGVIALSMTFVVSFTTTTAVRFLPQRRRMGPHRANEQFARAPRDGDQGLPARRHPPGRRDLDRADRQRRRNVRTVRLVHDARLRSAADRDPRRLRRPRTTEGVVVREATPRFSERLIRWHRTGSLPAAVQ